MDGLTYFTAVVGVDRDTLAEIRRVLPQDRAVSFCLPDESGHLEVLMIGANPVTPPQEAAA